MSLPFFPTRSGSTERLTVKGQIDKHRQRSTRACLCKQMLSQTWSQTYFLCLTSTHNSTSHFLHSHFPLSPYISPYPWHTKMHAHTRTHTRPSIAPQWSSHSLPLTSQQAVFHLPQIALVCHPKLCLQSCLPTPLQHIAHLIGLRTSFWICKSRSCIIIRDIQMKDSAVNWHFWMC